MKDFKQFCDTPTEFLSDGNMKLLMDEQTVLAFEIAFFSSYFMLASGIKTKKGKSLQGWFCSWKISCNKDGLITFSLPDAN